MADIRPFRGIRYNESQITNLAAVICPPYDIISPPLQQELYHRSEYNFVRVEYNRELPQDSPADNKYTRSAAALQQWLKQSVLVHEKVPAIYLHDQYFYLQGKEYKRRGIIIRLKLEEWDKKVVLPHEGTLSQPKSDRLNLLWACKANTSPILGMFQDNGNIITNLLAGQSHNSPLFEAFEDNGDGNRVWAITNPDILNTMKNAMAGQSIYIADGHHRYESALTYQREMRANFPSSKEEPFDFVMMTLVSFSDPGLVILPPHRLVRGVQRSVLNSLRNRLNSIFDIEEWPLSTPGIWDKMDNVFASSQPTNDTPVKVLLYGLTPGNLSMLTLKNKALINQFIPSFHSDIYKRLDVSIIDHVIMDKVLEMDKSKESSSLEYSYDRFDVVDRVNDEEFQLAFILNPVKVETIKAIADIGDRMPRKSTYFYPKLPSGLVVNPLT